MPAPAARSAGDRLRELRFDFLCGPSSIIYLLNCSFLSFARPVMISVVEKVCNLQ